MLGLKLEVELLCAGSPAHLLLGRQHTHAAAAAATLDATARTRRDHAPAGGARRLQRGPPRIATCYGPVCQPHCGCRSGAWSAC
jgi:hypothetical protein